MSMPLGGRLVLGWGVDLPSFSFDVSSFDVSQKTMIFKITLITLLPVAFFGFNFLCAESISFSLQRL